MIYLQRDKTLQLSDEKLIKECQISFFKASGKGGQKKNKTSNAVRIKHNLTKITSQASNSRQQSINRFYALRRLRLIIAETIRLPHKTWDKPLIINKKNPLFPLFTAHFLDILANYNWQINQAANFFNLSRNQLTKICLKYNNIHTLVNQNRQKFNLSLI